MDTFTVRVSELMALARVLAQRQGDMEDAAKAVSRWIVPERLTKEFEQTARID